MVSKSRGGMGFRKTATSSIVMVVLMALLLASGCGGKTQSGKTANGKAESGVSFPATADEPVVTYTSYKAIAPVYNPDVPVTVIYGDGTVIKKEDPYRFTTGTLSPQQMEELLKTLEEGGFFELESEYKNEVPLAGGTTDTVTVVTSDGTHEVSAEGGAGPPGWDDMLTAITGVKASDESEYVPSSIALFAREATEVPQGAAVQPWPGDSSELAAAASADAGTRLNGEEAGTAWKAVQSSFSQNSSGEGAYWSAGDKTYTYVYASPILPGIEQQQ
jgi:hypothetical protein